MRFRHCLRRAKAVGAGWPNSYLPYYDYPAEFVDLAGRIGPRTDAILDGLDDYYEHFREEAARDEPELRRHRGSKGFGDMALDVVAALSSDAPTEIVVNIPNRGTIDLFDDETVVECFAKLSSDGIERIETPSTPVHLRPLLAQLERYQRRTAEAAISGDFADLCRALATNPLVDDETTAKAMLQRAYAIYGDANIPAQLCPEGGPD